MYRTAGPYILARTCRSRRSMSAFGGKAEKPLLMLSLTAYDALLPRDSERCRSDVSRAFAYFHFLERPVTKIGGAGDHCHPGAPSRMPSSKQLNGDCSISPRFHFRCRARPRSQIVPNGRLRLNAFMKGLAPRIRTNDRHVYCPRSSAS